MPIKINGSTSGSVTLAAPATGSDVTLTLPGTTGTAALIGGNTYSGTHNFSSATVVEPAGRVIQVVQATTTTPATVTSTSFTDTGLSATITPTSSTSKILVIVSQAVSVNRNNNLAIGNLNLVRSSTQVYEAQYLFRGAVGESSVLENRKVTTIAYLDSPATTSATTYKTQVKANSGHTVQVQPDSYVSVMLLLEVTA